MAVYGQTGSTEEDLPGVFGAPCRSTHPAPPPTPPQQPPLPNGRYVALAPRDSDQLTLLATTQADRKLDELPPYQQLLKKFSQKEVRVGVLENCLPGRCCSIA